MINKLKKINLLTFVFLFFSIGVLIYAFSLGLQGNDFWWHIKVGEWIMNNHTIPKTDIFSWFASTTGTYWVSHEWFSEIILYFVMHNFGQIGIYVLSLCVALFLFASLVVVAGKDVEKNYLLSMIYILLFISILYLYCYGRPQIFTYILLTIQLFILYRYNNNPGSKAIYFIPLISCLWANFHGGSSNLVYLLCIILLLSSLFNFSYGKIVFTKSQPKYILQLIMVTVLSVLALCINPHGWRILTYPFENMSDNLMISFIAEWASPDIKDIGQLIFFFIPVIGVTINFFATDKKISGFDFLLYGFFTYLFFRSTRFIVFFMIASIFFGFKYLILSKKKPEFTNTVPEKIEVCVMFLGCFVFILFGFYNTNTTYHSDETLISSVVDDEFISLVKEDSPQRLFNDYNLGESLIYNDIPVFIDSRADVYSGEIFRDYVSLSNMTPMSSEYDNVNYIDEILEKYDFDAFLLESDSALVPYLNSHKDSYTLVKISDDFAYFKKMQ
jgi:hypothetical protein